MVTSGQCSPATAQVPASARQPLDLWTRSAIIIAPGTQTRLATFNISLAAMFALRYQLGWERDSGGAYVIQ